MKALAIYGARGNEHLPKSVFQENEAKAHFFRNFEILMPYLVPLSEANLRFLINYTYYGQFRRFKIQDIRSALNLPFWKAKQRSLWHYILLSVFLNKLFACIIAHLRETDACRLYNMNQQFTLVAERRTSRMR